MDGLREYRVLVPWSAAAGGVPAGPGRGYEVVEFALELPVENGVARIDDVRAMPLLTAIDGAPPGSILRLGGGAAVGETGGRVGAVPIPRQRYSASMSEVARGFAEYLTPAQLEAMPEVFDLRAYDEVTLEMPPELAPETVTVRGLNQLTAGPVPRGYVRERYM